MNHIFWRALDAAIRDVRRGRKLVVIMDANARTGGRVAGSEPKILGAYGRDNLNGNGRRLLGLAADNQLAFVNTFFCTPKNDVSHTSQQASKSKLQHRAELRATGGGGTPRVDCSASTSSIQKRR